MRNYNMLLSVTLDYRNDTTRVIHKNYNVRTACRLTN